LTPLLRRPRYARVSTVDQDPALQLDALAAAGCQRIYTDRASGTLTARPQLDLLLDHALAGDTVCAWRLDRLGRSLPHLIQTVTGLHDRGVGFRSLQESIDTTTVTGTLIFHLLAALSAFSNATCSANAPEPAWPPPGPAAGSAVAHRR